MTEETTITTTRDKLIEAFRQWDAQAKDGKWPAKPNPERSADHLIALLSD